MKRGLVLLLLLGACAAPAGPTPPPKAASKVAQGPKGLPKKPAPPSQNKEKTVSIKVDASLDADALVSTFQKKLGPQGFRLVADTDARFFITFKLKETQTGAPPSGREIARVQFVVSALDRKEGIKLPAHSGDEDGLGATLDAALDTALRNVAEKVTPLLIAEMVARLSAED